MAKNQGVSKTSKKRRAIKERTLVSMKSTDAPIVHLQVKRFEKSLQNHSLDEIEKIHHLKESIQQGEYVVDTEKLAKEILKEILQTAGFPLEDE